MNTSNQYSISKNRYLSNFHNSTKVSSILIEIDVLIKTADENLDIVKRSAKNMKFLRTGVVGAKLLDPEAINEEFKAMIDRMAKPVEGNTANSKNIKITPSMRTMASFMLDKAVREREEEIKNKNNPKYHGKNLGSKSPSKKKPLISSQIQIIPE
jgi:predicted RNA methylase